MPEGWYETSVILRTHKYLAPLWQNCCHGDLALRFVHSWINIISYFLDILYVHLILNSWTQYMVKRKNKIVNFWTATGRHRRGTEYIFKSQRNFFGVWIFSWHERLSTRSRKKCSLNVTQGATCVFRYAQRTEAGSPNVQYHQLQTPCSLAA